MPNNFIPTRIEYTGTAPTAVAEYQNGETMTLPGSLQLTGSGRRFLADFSNAVGSDLSGRALFQTSVNNAGTELTVVPTGTATYAGIKLVASSAANNANTAVLYADSTGAILSSTKQGSSSFQPLMLMTSDIVRFRINTDGSSIQGTALNPDPIGNNAIGMRYLNDAFLDVRSNTFRCFGAAVSSTGVAYHQFWYGGVSPAQVGSITTNGSTTAYNTSSDYRLKTSINDADRVAAIERIRALRLRQWDWIASGEHEDNGFIAHELAAVKPSAVTGVKDALIAVGDLCGASGELLASEVPRPSDLPDGHTWTRTEVRPAMQGRDDSKLVPDLVAAVQFLLDERALLRAEVEALKQAS